MSSIVMVIGTAIALAWGEGPELARDRPANAIKGVVLTRRMFSRF
jgi:hypothetical protein